MSAAEREALLGADRYPMGLNRDRGLRLATTGERSVGVDAARGFGVSVVFGPKRAVVRPVGELDLSTAEQLDATLDEVLARGPSEIVLDLRQLQFCDAAGLQVFVGIRGRAAGVGTSVWLEGPARTVRRVLEISGLGWLIGDSGPDRRLH